MAKAQVNSTSAAYQVMEPRLAKVNALLGGTETMRDAGEVYLPRYARETERNWRTRLTRATLYNYFKRCVDSLSSKPFSAPVRLKDFDPKLEEITEDIDRMGTDFTVFCADLFKSALARGLAFVYVDYPTSDTVPQTFAEEKALGFQPFFRVISPENLIFARTEVIEGKEVLTQIRVKIDELVPDGPFGERISQRVEIITPDSIEVQELQNKRWVTTSTRPNTLGEIPLVVYYADKEDFFVSRLPLGDLADKNIEHWQSSSDQRNALTVARFPMLAGKGLTRKEMDEIVLAPNQSLSTENPAGEFYYLEHRGIALAAGRQDMDTIKAEMAELVMDLLSKTTSRASATEWNLSSREATSTLEMMVIRFADFLKSAFVFAAKWMDLPENAVGTVDIDTTFVDDSNQKDIDALIAARNSGDLTREEYLAELQRRGILGKDFVIVERQPLPVEPLKSGSTIADAPVSKPGDAISISEPPPTSDSRKITDTPA